MHRLLILAFLGIPHWALASGKKIVGIPKLSIEVETTELYVAPSRTEKIFAFEKMGRASDLLGLDELSRDLLFLKEQKAGKIPTFKQRYFEPAVKTPLATGKTIVFLDINFAPAEVNAAREAAKVRGDSFIVFPARTDVQQRDIEKEYRNLLKLEKAYFECQKDAAADCRDLGKRHDESYSRLETLTSQLKSIESLAEVFVEISKQNLEPSVIIFSGHSDGSTFSGYFGELNFKDISQTLLESANLTKNVTSILLWGCYTGTLSNLTDAWQKATSSEISFVGYRNQAPLGIRPASGNLMREFLVNEIRFRDTVGIKERHQIFRSLPHVAELDSTALFQDYYYAYDKVALVEELLKICKDFDPSLYEKFVCYNEGKSGCENPPQDHRGPLRTLYNFLQINKHCSVVLDEIYPELPTPEQLVRLIFIDNIKTNFAHHNQNLFRSYNSYLEELDLSSNLRIDNYLGATRASDIKLLKQTTDEFKPLGIRDHSYVNHPNWLAIVAMDYAIENFRWLLGIDNGFEPCTPFSWVEPDAKEPDQCGFGTYLNRPLSASLLESLYDTKYFTLFVSWSHSEVPDFFSLIYRLKLDREQIKHSYLHIAQEAVEELEARTGRTEREENWLTLSRQNIEKVQKMESSEVTSFLIDVFEKAIVQMETLLVEARKEPYKDESVKNLLGYQDLFRSKIATLRSNSQTFSAESN